MSEPAVGGHPGGEPVVRTTSGTLRGEWDNGVAGFRGVPYAAPPTGALRLAAPARARPWDGIRPAVEWGPPPPQSGPLGASDASDRDDWLTLNVWTTEPAPGADLPVLVWFPGGGYVMGDAALPEYDGSELALGGIVVVTVNHRVGIEGFGYLDGAPANRGLLDQVAALEWLHDNVMAFGGDPDRTTIGGQSAGGGSVAAMLAMPRAAGLFRRAIAQSVPGTYFSPELATDITAACAAELGVPSDAAGFATAEPALLPVAADAVSEAIAHRRGRWGAVTHRPIPIAPVVDGDVLPTTPWRALSTGAARDIDLLVGHTRDEHRLFSLVDGTLGHVTPEQTETALRMLAPGPDGPRRYRQTFPMATDEELYELVNGDWLFRMPSLHLAEAQSTGGGQVHLYELTWPAPGLGGGLGACHGLDVPLVFGTLGRGQPGALVGDPPPEAATALSRVMRSAWTAFVAHGEPGWASFDPERRLTRILDEEPAVAPYPEERSRLLWRHHTFGPLPLLPA
jgi:para-nitrobenzyl esterase